MPKWILCCNLSVALLLFAPLLQPRVTICAMRSRRRLTNCLCWMRLAQLGCLWAKAQAGRLSVLDPVWHVKQTDAARHSKNLYEHISTDIWVKPEPKGARCLIGPYSDFALASKELKRSKTGDL